MSFIYKTYLTEFRISNLTNILFLSERGIGFLPQLGPLLYFTCKHDWKNILKSNSLHWSAAKSLKISQYAFFKVYIHCHFTENAKFNITFLSRLCSSECIPAFALHKCCAKWKQPVKQRASHRNKQTFHFLPSCTASALCLPLVQPDPLLNSFLKQIGSTPGFLLRMF